MNYPCQCPCGCEQGYDYQSCVTCTDCQNDQHQWNNRKMIDNPTVQCNKCGWQYEETADDLIFDCPVCLTEEYLMDLENTNG